MTLPNAPFAWPIRVYYEDTDAQGVVFYANYFNFMERARTEWIRSLGMEQDDLLENDRRMFVVVDLKARFIKPARFNDELLVTARLNDRSRARFVIDQAIYRKDAPDDPLCESTVTAACLDADSLRPVRLPERLFERA